MRSEIVVRICQGYCRLRKGSRLDRVGFFNPSDRLFVVLFKFYEVPVSLLSVYKNEITCHYKGLPCR